MDKIYVYIIDLPTKVHEMVAKCADGYTIYINARLSYLGRLEAYDHAMWHINHNDLEKDNVQAIEGAAWRRNEKNSDLYEGQHGQTST